MCVPSARKRRECFGAGTGREDRKNQTKQLNSRYHAAKLFSCVRQLRRIHVLLSTEVQGKMNANVKDLQRFSDITSYLKSHKVLTVADLESHMDEIQSAALPLKARIKKAEARIAQIGKINEFAEQYKRTDAVHAQYLKIHWKGRQLKFAQTHKTELDEWSAANRYLRKNLPDFVYRPKALAAEEEALKKELVSLKEEVEPLDAEVSMMKDVRYFVKDLLPELLPEEKTITPERKAEKKSVLDGLHKKQEYLRQREDPPRRNQKKEQGIDL